MIIYKITNKINGKIYIGQTTLTIKERIASHLKTAKIENRRSAIHLAINSYGIGSFHIEQIDSAISIEELNRKEIYWIETLNCLSPNGYNIRMGGSQGGRCSDELKNKISARIKIAHLEGRKRSAGYYHSEETKKKISIAKKGKTLSDFSEEHRKNMSIAQKGLPKPKSEIWRENHRAKMSGRKNSEETKRKRAVSLQKSVVCTTTGETYSSLKEAAKMNNLSSANLSSLLKKQKGFLRNRITGKILQFKFKDQ